MREPGLDANVAVTPVGRELVSPHYLVARETVVVERVDTPEAVAFDGGGYTDSVPGWEIQFTSSCTSVLSLCLVRGTIPYSSRCVVESGVE